MKATNKSDALISSKLKTTLLAPLLVIWIILGFLTMTIVHSLRLPSRTTLPLFFHTGFCKLFSLHREVIGAPANEQTTFFVSNHASYLDVFVIGSLVRGTFIAKSEVASWPVFGKFAALQKTLFLERNPRRARAQVNVVSDHLRDTGSLIVFPEGTSTAGNVVKKFRSSLFAGAIETPIQPITVAYRDYNGRRMSDKERANFAWYLPDVVNEPKRPNKPFTAHILDCLGFQACTVVIEFHEPIMMSQFETRKSCAQHCENVVRNSLFKILLT